MKQRLKVAIIGSTAGGELWYGSYGMVAAYQGGLAEHWGFGFKVEPAAMVARGIIRLLEEYQAYDIKEEIVFISNYAEVISNRSNLVFSQMRTRATTEKKVRSTDRQATWEELHEMKSAIDGYYNLEHIRDSKESECIRLAKKVARETARRAAEKIRNLSSQKDDRDFSWLKSASSTF